MKYPTDLVHQSGAKAGILMYVGQHLPAIPQARMLVKTPAEPLDDFLKRVEDAHLGWPRLFRSSAVAELDGYEGDFPTVFIDSFEQGRASVVSPGYCGYYSQRPLFEQFIRDTIERIENSPQELKTEGGKHKKLPDKIAVIVAEKSPSLVTGTYLKHPNQADIHLISCTMTRSIGSDDPEHSNFMFDSKRGVQPLKYFSQKDVEKWLPQNNRPDLERELTDAIVWYDQMISLPEMDQQWSYQIEFGLFPTCLYQVRPFRPIEYADFSLPKKRFEEDLPDAATIAMGVTPKEGLTLKIVTADNLQTRSNDPTVFVGEMRELWKAESLRNNRANLIDNSFGFLAHNDIKAMRSAHVTGIYLQQPHSLSSGEWVNIKSDGTRIELSKA